MGGRPQAASLVQGLRPRNAHLGLPTILALPHHRGMAAVSPNQPSGCQPFTTSKARLAAKLNSWSRHTLPAAW